MVRERKHTRGGGRQSEREGMPGGGTIIRGGRHTRREKTARGRLPGVGRPEGRTLQPQAWKGLCLLDGHCTDHGLLDSGII